MSNSQINKEIGARRKNRVMRRHFITCLATDIWTNWHVYFSPAILTISLFCCHFTSRMKYLHDRFYFHVSQSICFYSTSSYTNVMFMQRIMSRNCCLFGLDSVGDKLKIVFLLGVIANTHISIHTSIHVKQDIENLKSTAHVETCNTILNCKFNYKYFAKTRLMSLYDDKK